MQKNAQKRLLRVFVELYNRSQQPILTRDLFKNIHKVKAKDEEKGSGKNYPLETYLSTGVLRVDKVWSKGKLEVVWNTGYPDLDMVEMLWLYRKNGGKTIKAVEPEVIVEVLRHENQEAEPTKDLVADVKEEVNSGILSIDEICKTFDVEFENYRPNTKTIPKVIKMLNVMEFKAGERWCHKDSLFCLDGENKEGKFITINHRATSQFLRKRLVAFDVLKRNPDNNSEYLYVAEYDDIETYARRLAFAINYLSDKGALEQKKAERVAKAQQLRLKKKIEDAKQERHEERLKEVREEAFLESIQEEIDKDVVVAEEVPTPSFGFSDDLLEALDAHATQLRLTRESNEVLTAELRENKADNEAVRKELKEMHEVNNLISADLSEKLVVMHQGTVKFSEVVKALKLNNLISEK